MMGSMSPSQTADMQRHAVASGFGGGDAGGGGGGGAAPPPHNPPQQSLAPTLAVKVAAAAINLVL